MLVNGEYALFKQFKERLVDKNRPRLIFINHEETLTGAPRVLHEIINDTIKSNKYEVFVVSLKGGDDKLFWDHYSPIRIRSNHEIDDLGMIFREIDPDIVYANTVASAVAITVAKKILPKVKIVFHIHETDKSLALYDNILRTKLNHTKTLDDCFVESDHLITVNQNTFNHLCDLGIPLSKIHMQEQGINVDNWRKNYQQNPLFKYVNPNGKIICSVGTVSYRKGYDRFLNLASEMPQHLFLWIGSYNCNGEIVEFEGIKTHLPKNVIMLGRQKNPIQYMKQCDIFLLASREDPFPLVLLEAKLIGLFLMVNKLCGDGYKLCEKRDLIFKDWEKEKIISYINSEGTFRSEVEINMGLYDLSRCFALVGSILDECSTKHDLIKI